MEEKRNEDEIYIPIPSWIHKIYPNFFPTVEENFNLILPNKQVINAKVCQSYSVVIGNENQQRKSNTSNPNNAWEMVIERCFKVAIWKNCKNRRLV